MYGTWVRWQNAFVCKQWKFDNLADMHSKLRMISPLPIVGTHARGATLVFPGGILWDSIRVTIRLKLRLI